MTQIILVIASPHCCHHSVNGNQEQKSDLLHIAYYIYIWKLVTKCESNIPVMLTLDTSASDEILGQYKELRMQNVLIFC